MTHQIPPPEIDRVLTLTEVRSAVSYSSSSLRRMIKAGAFPEPVRLGPGRVGWRQSLVAKWLDKREVYSADQSSHLNQVNCPDAQFCPLAERRTPNVKG